MRVQSTFGDNRGQAMIETALALPLVLTLVLNAVNLGYFFLVAVNLAAGTRNAAEYSIIGPNSPAGTDYASAGPGSTSVAALVYQDLTGAVYNPANITVKICTPSAGKTSGYANCVQCTSSTSCGSATAGSSTSSNLDPESSVGLVLNRVEITYSFPPLIPGSPFNLTLLSTMYNSGNGRYTFRRHIEMSAM